MVTKLMTIYDYEKKGIYTITRLNIRRKVYKIKLKYSTLCIFFNRAKEVYSLIELSRTFT